MNRRLARWLVRLYPRPWRDRYGAEFEALLRDGEGGVRAAVNVVCSAVYESIFPTRLSAGGLAMNAYPNSVFALTKKPSAFLPIAMSLTALTILLVEIARSGPGGPVRAPDEGTTAHLWQILMAGQLPVLLFFAIKWLPRVPRQTMWVLAMQVVAAVASMAPVFYFNL